MAEAKDDATAKDKVTAADVTGITPGATLKKLLKKARDTKKEVAGLSGEFGQMVANAVENSHLHRKAFSFTKQLDQMADEKLAECMTHFEHYLEAAGINARVEKVQRLPLKDGPDAEDGEDNGDKVVKFGGKREAAEATA